MKSLSSAKIELLSRLFPRLSFQSDCPLSKITYFKIGGPAALLVEATSYQDFVELITESRKNQIDFVVLGGGSNVVVADEGIDKLVILTRHQEVFKLDSQDSSSSFLIQADSGVKTSDLVNKTVKMGLTGLEPFFGVPGRLGGAIYNNSHFQTELIGEYVAQVEVLTPGNEIIWLSKEECDFKYDHSRFQQSGEIVLRVQLSLAAGDIENSKQIIRDSMMYRSKTQPLHLPSSGCIFKNVKNNSVLIEKFPQFAQKSHISAGFLIDQAGLKGLREGDIEVSSVHAAFMVNHGQGTVGNVKKLVEKVKQKVKEKFEVELEEEIFWLA